ncbi:MAG: hypothetical protein JWQ45_1538 [Blastococcus sp.]|nr:hypothetical protein [Blastococcus sp.]
MCPLPREGSRVTRVRWAAFALALVPAVVMFGPVAADSGGFAVWGLGLPVLLSALPILSASSRYVVAVTWLAAVALLSWSLLLALGVGAYFLPAAFAELVAAAWSRPPEHLRG